MADSSPRLKRSRKEPDFFTFSAADSQSSASSYVLEDFEACYSNRHFWFYSDTEIVEQKTLLVELDHKDVIDPWDANPSTGLLSWVLNPCADCSERQSRSSLAMQLSRVNFQEIRQGITPSSLPRKFMAFGKHAALAAKFDFANGYAKSVLFHLMNTAQESWLCRHHYRLIHMYNPGTFHEIGGVEVFLCRDDDLDITIRGCPDLTISTDKMDSNVVLTIGEMKKGWKDGKRVENTIETGLGKSQLGQLLTYMVGHSVKLCTKGGPFHPLLGIFMEGSKVILVRGQVMEMVPKFYRLKLGICPGGTKALDILTQTGAMRIIETMARFISHVPISEDDNSNSTTSSLATTASNSPA